jgi:nicotinamidase-related amidase
VPAGPHPPAGGLVDASDSVLVAIDVQGGFLDRVEAVRREGLVERITFLVEVARRLGIPTIATVERPEDWGGLTHALGLVLTGVEPIRKEVFALGDDDAVWPEIARHERRTAVLCGLETDVCVAQSALSLLVRGYRVVAVSDAVASPGEAHEHGLARMRDAGVLVLSAKQLFYDWMRTVPATRRFHADHPDLVEPPGLGL